MRLKKGDKMDKKSIMNSVKSVISDKLCININDIYLYDEFEKNLGVKNNKLLDILCDIERQFHIKILPCAIFEIKIVLHLVQLVDKKLDEKIKSERLKNIYCMIDKLSDNEYNELYKHMTNKKRIKKRRKDV